MIIGRDRARKMLKKKSSRLTRRKRRNERKLLT